MKTRNFISCIVLLLIFGSANANQNNQDNKTQNAVEERTQEIRDSLNMIMEKAKAGDADAMNEVGTWYYSGKHVKQDYKQAYDWWKQASLKSNVRAIANLGLCYQFGRGIEKDSIDAIRLYQKSIKEGNKALLNQRAENASKNAFDAMLVGSCYENGIGVKKDYAQAAAFYADAASKGSIDAMRQAGICYLNAKENSDALKYFEQGATKDDLVSLYWAGKMLLGEMNVTPDKPQAVIYLLKAAEGGMPAAEVEMGNLYSEGNGVVKSETQAAGWYHKAALQGNPKGMWNYGTILKEGRGTTQDYDQALFWLAEAVPAGYQRSFRNMMSQLASTENDPFLYYVKGLKLYLVDGKMSEASDQFKKVEKAGIDEGKIMQSVILASKRNEKQNSKKAAKELEKLATENAEAAFYLATLYESGNGVEKNMQKAIDYYRKSADMGYGKAQSYLGDIYYEGRGVDKDIIEAISLYELANKNRQLSQNGALRLAECYENGNGGLSPDKKKAEALRKEKNQDNVIILLQEINI